jgi:hypothetical protein
MIYELRTYQLVVGGLPDYLEVARTKILPGVAEHGLKPVGFWYTDIGPLNEVVHLWAYKDLNERQEKWGKWARDPRRAEIVGKLAVSLSVKTINIADRFFTDAVTVAPIERINRQGEQYGGDTG